MLHLLAPNAWFGGTANESCKAVDLVQLTRVACGYSDLVGTLHGRPDV
jgi:hypothetical protein